MFYPHLLSQLAPIEILFKYEKTNKQDEVYNNWINKKRIRWCLY